MPSERMPSAPMPGAPMPSVLVLDKSQDPLALGEQDLVGIRHLVLLCWLAPETLAELEARSGARCHSFVEVVGGLADWERHAIGLAQELSRRGPRHDGLPLRLVVEEELFREASEVEAVRRAAGLCWELVRGNPQGCELRLQARWRRLFRLLPGWADVVVGPGDEDSPEEVRPSLPRRLARRLRGAFLAGDLRRQVAMLFDQLDADYRVRTGLARWLRAPRPEPGPITVFSSYINNSRILGAIAPHLPGPVHWLVNHRLQGETGSGGDLLWRFAPAGSRWAAVGQDPDAGADAGAEDLPSFVQAWLDASPIWQRYWLRHGPAAVLRLTACWEHYLDTVRPRLVVMANQHSLEGWFCRLAQRRGIPVLQVLHGVLGGEYYTKEPILSEALLVWGDFWRKRWPKSEQRRIHVVAPGSVVARVERCKRPKPRLTWFSWPFTQLPFFHDTELSRTLVGLLHDFLEVGACEVILRAHPLENLSDLVEFWRSHYGPLPPGLELSQWEPMEKVLARTDVALMFRSTVMLDCFASGIPVVIPGWIEFDWQDELEGLQGIHLARDVQDLRTTLAAWLTSVPRLDPQQTRQFVLPESEESPKSIRRLVEGLIIQGCAGERSGGARHDKGHGIITKGSAS